MNQQTAQRHLPQNKRCAATEWAVGGLLGGCALGVMIWLMFPVAGCSPFSNPEESAAENTAYNLKNAISTFHTEYKEFPVDSVVTDATVDSSSFLMAVLLGEKSNAKPNGRNPRRIVFYSDKKARRMDGNKFRKGIHLKSKTLWDPWGNFYRVRTDNDGDDHVSNPNPKEKAATVASAIIVWSAGPDGRFETWKDNVKTW